MEKIQPGKYVEMAYNVYEIGPDGKETLRHQMDREDPERIIFGVTQYVIRPLEEALEGKQVGDKFDVTCTAEEAFGPYDPEAVVTLEKEIFLVDGVFDAEFIKPGAEVPMMTGDGFRVNGKVVSVGKDSVKMDFNHPLAGKPVRLEGEILTVRDATPEELKPSCCCSGGGCADGDCGGADCDCNGSPKGGCCGK